MAEIINGFDRITVPCPIELRKGSTATIRRTVYLFDHDTGQETLMDISPTPGDVDNIVWQLFQSLDGDDPVLEKKQSIAEIDYFDDGTDGIYEFEVSAGDLEDLQIGLYTALLTITVGGKPIEFRPYPVSLAS